jgi:hypothetical protein
VPEPADLESLEAALERLNSSSRPPTSQAVADEIRLLMGSRSIEAVYRDQVISNRTRSYRIGVVGDNADISIIYTLLGFELKIGHRRLLCPDLATARYLSVFARLRCSEIAVPYDITRVSRIADELESVWQRMSLLAERLTAERSARLKSRVMKSLIEETKREIYQLGAGEKFPEFTAPRRRKRR